MTGKYMNTQLRSAVPSDANTLADIYLLARKTYLPYAPLAHTDAEIRRWVANEMLTKCQVTIAQHKGQDVGYIAISKSDGCSWIDQLYLLPGTTSLGTGALLLSATLMHLERPVRLYTFQANVGARRFYERFGFTAIAFSDGSTNEERCPDVLYELA